MSKIAGSRRFDGFAHRLGMHMPGRTILGTPWRWVLNWIDQRDEQRARLSREAFGRKGWLLSWHSESGGWRARISGAATVRTIERTGTSRRNAIARAERAMTRLVEYHDAHRPRTQLDPGTHPLEN